MEENKCSICVWARPFGGENDNRCCAWSCEYINYREAAEAWRKQKEEEINLANEQRLMASR